MRPKYSNLPVFGFQEFELPEGLGPIGDFEGEQDPPNDPPAVDFDLQKVLGDNKAKTAITDWAERELVAPVKNKNKELLDKLTKYKVKTKNDKGEEVEVYIDPAEAISAIDQVKKGMTPEMQKEIDRAVAAANERNNAIIDGLKSQLEEAKKQVETTNNRRYDMMIENQLQNALINSGIKAAKLPLHYRYLKEFLEVAEEGGREMVVIMDEAGKPRYGSSGLMTVSEFVNEYRNKEGIGEDWSPTLPGGSGTNPQRGGRGNISLDQNLPPAERMKILRRSGTR